MFKKNGKYFADYYVSGKRIRKSFETATEARAQEAKVKKALRPSRSSKSSKSGGRA